MKFAQLLTATVVLLSGCGNLDEVEYRTADGASGDCVAGANAPVHEVHYPRGAANHATGFAATERLGEVWASTADDDDCACEDDAGEDDPPRAHRYLWVAADRAMSIDAVSLQRGDGEPVSVGTLFDCPWESGGRDTCDRMFGPPRGCGEDDSHRIPAGFPLILSLETVIEANDLITVFTCDDPVPADNLAVRIGVEPFAVVGNPLVSCPLEDADSSVTCTVPELPPVVEPEIDSYEEALLEYFEGEPRDPGWSDEAEQTIRDNIATGTTTYGESLFDNPGFDEWCVDNWSTWSLDVDCRTTMCRLFAFGGPAIESCLVWYLNELVPLGFGAYASWELDFVIGYYSREGHDLPNF